MINAQGVSEVIARLMRGIGLTVRVFLTLVLICFGLWGRYELQGGMDRPLFVGIYGERPITLTCLEVGRVHLEDLSLGQVVTKGQKGDVLAILVMKPVVVQGRFASRMSASKTPVVSLIVKLTSSVE